MTLLNRKTCGDTINERKVFLIRVGMDTTYGGFVSPIFPDDNYVFVPIPNARTGNFQIDAYSKNLPAYSELKTNSPIPLTDYLPKDAINLNGELIENIRNTRVHNDPEFKTMTYGEKKTKKVVYNEVKNFEEGDHIVFYATFFPCSRNFRYKDYTLEQLQSKQRRKKQYYICAFLKLKYPPIDASNYKEYEDEIKNNAHYLRGDFDRHDESFVLKGTDDSGWLRPIRMDGERKRGNYLMNDMMAQYKLKNVERRGLNRCYCRLKSSIIPLLREHKIEKQ